MITINASVVKLEALRQEYQFYMVGSSGSFTTALFDAFKSADIINFPKLAEAFPEHGYIIAESHRIEFLKIFELE